MICLVTFNLFDSLIKIMTLHYNLINKFIFETSLTNFVAIFKSFLCVVGFKFRHVLL